MPTLRDCRSDSLEAKSKYPTRRKSCKNQQKTLKNQVRRYQSGFQNDKIKLTHDFQVDFSLKWSE